MMFTDDPIRDFLEYSSNQEEELRKRPVCDRCGEHIVEEDCYVLEDMVFCEDCFKEFAKKNFRVKTEKLMEE